MQFLDLRPRLKVIADRASRRERRGPVASVTLHYNGPPVAGHGRPDAEVRQIVGPDWRQHTSALGADSLQYHYCVLSNGVVAQTRDEALIAWHCGHRAGNESSLAVHLPLGGLQDATGAQWAATLALFEELMRRHNLVSRQAVRLHSEWKPTLCPGPHLTRRLREWRSGLTDGGLYRIRDDVASANVRQGPGRTFPVAAQMWPGDAVDADAIVQGEAVGGEARWLHRRDGVGFVHLSLVRPA